MSPASAFAASNASLERQSFTRPSPTIPLDAALHRREARPRARDTEGGRSATGVATREQADIGLGVRPRTAGVREGWRNASGVYGRVLMTRAVSLGEISERARVRDALGGVC